MNAYATIRFGVLITAATLLDPAGNVAAQESPYLDFNHPSVTVDLSVIDDSGYGAPTSSMTAPMNRLKRGKLLIPSSHMPTSMLHVPPVKGTTVAPSRIATPKVAPASKPKAMAKVVATPAPVATPVVAPVTAPPPVATPAPVAAPAPAAPKQPKIAKAEPAAPKKLMAPAPATAKSAPPPPTVAAAPKVTSAEETKTEPKKVEAAQKPKTLEASLPPSKTVTEPGLALQVVFANDATRLPADAKSSLLALADKVKTEDNLRLQLMAYAGGSSLSASLARRLSLSRALSVRSFLIENGIRSTRIDVRALGNKTNIEPLNRVDLNITER